MVGWLSTETGFRAIGQTGAVTVETDDWERARPVHELPATVSTGATGRCRRLSVNAPVAADPEPSDTQTLTTTTSPTLTLRFSSAGAVTTDGDGATVSFQTPSPVSIGVSERVHRPEPLTVPPSPAGIAAAVTAAGDRLPDGPERSFPALRPAVPRIEFDASATRDDDDTRPIQFTVPDELESVLVAAPLAYYLGASLTVGASRPRIEIPALEFSLPFTPLPAFASETAATLQRLVALDSAARRVEGERLDDAPLAALELTPDHVTAVEPSVRYATFLDADQPAATTWHRSTYVEPTIERARILPALLDQLSLVYPAEATAVSPQELLESALEDFFRGVVSVTPLAPELGVGVSHGWLADGAVVDAFKTTPAAYDNATERTDDAETLRLTIVSNDPEMDEELALAETYRNRTNAVSTEIEIHESLTTGELARVFERPQTYVHYVGHCEEAGLRCPDGHLSASSLSRSGARAFFLNACGSYREGETLVEKGSVAGAVTLDAVLNEQAATVGQAFGTLLAAGYSVRRALALARRRVPMGRDYAAVGDATVRITPSVGDAPLLVVEPRGDEFAIRYEVAPESGGTYRDPFTGRHRRRGAWQTTVVDRARLRSVLEGRGIPVEFDGSFRWSGELAADLRSQGL
ncbi:hypothetical protein BRC71_11100 [Halobacteriales archaeon QH_7_65_31]|nr:MAG: hypothetical protein BRC71_11100 [Halobacteriales archaeon QH_7_65_31]